MTWVLVICVSITWGMCGSTNKYYFDTEDECLAALEQVKDTKSYDIGYAFCKKDDHHGETP